MADFAPDDPNAGLTFGFLSELTAIHFPGGAVYIVITTNYPSDGGTAGGRIVFPPGQQGKSPANLISDAGGFAVSPVHTSLVLPKEAKINFELVSETTNNTTAFAMDMTTDGAPGGAGDWYGLWSGVNVSANDSDIVFQNIPALTPPITPCPNCNSRIVQAFTNLGTGQFPAPDITAVTLTDYSASNNNEYMVMMPVSGASEGGGKLGSKFRFTINNTGLAAQTFNPNLGKVNVKSFSSQFKPPFKALPNNIKTLPELAHIAGTFPDSSIGSGQTRNTQFVVTATLTQLKPFTTWTLTSPNMH